MSEDALNFWKTIQSMIKESSAGNTPVRGSYYKDPTDNGYVFKPDAHDDDAEYMVLHWAGNSPLPAAGTINFPNTCWAAPLGNHQYLFLFDELVGTDGFIIQQFVAFMRNITFADGVGMYADPGTGSVLSGFDTLNVGDVNGVIKGTVANVKAQSSSDTASSTNTATFVDCIAQTVALPSYGFWTIQVTGTVSATHTVAGGGWRIQTLCNGVAGAIHIPSPAQTTAYTSGTTADSFTGILGGSTITCKIQARPNSAGTLALNNPQIQIYAFRTS